VDAFDLGVLILRVVVGVSLAAHGYNKFFGGGRIPGTARWFDSMGMRPGKVHAVLAASMELGAGLALAIGLLTPFAAAGWVGLMFVAAYTVHVKNGFFIVKDGFEYNLVLATVAIAVATMGPGEISFDELIGLRLDGWWGLVVSLGGGLAGAGLLLGTSYRPPVKDTAAAA
jgi:putative oxidoreductase